MTTETTETPAPWGEALASVRADSERGAQIAALRAAAPLRRPVAQADVDGLGLFDAVRSPTMI